MTTPYQRRIEIETQERIDRFQSVVDELDDAFNTGLRERSGDKKVCTVAGEVIRYLGDSLITLRQEERLLQRDFDAVLVRAWFEKWAQLFEHETEGR
jgi:hypothetical protein